MVWDLPNLSETRGIRPLAVGFLSWYNIQALFDHKSMQAIGELIEEKRNIILQGADALTSKGFTQVPNHVLESDQISPGAKLTYAMLLKYAWQNDFCFPGQERLAKDMGAGKRSVVRYVAELEQGDFITIKRRGQGKTNIYVVNCRSAVDKKQG